MVASATQEIQGIVCGVNAKGVKLQGEESWRNYSKWATLPDTLPARGDVVVVSVDGAGFIRGLSVSPSESKILDSKNCESQDSPPAVDTKSVQIARMNALGHAVTVLATNGVVDADEALALAERFAGWVLS